MNKSKQECSSFLFELKNNINKNVHEFAFSILFASMIFSLWFGFILSLLYTNSQFRVIYSLDKKQNDKEIINIIDKADKYIYFAIYYFTKDNIAKALVSAKKRGVEVFGITDNQASRDSNKDTIDYIRANGIPVVVQKHKDGIMHMKVIVTEDAYASGSYNWTKSATISNDEILEIGTNESVRKQYKDIVEELLRNNSN